MSTCRARQHSDQMLCSYCGLAWDVNDPDPPQCREGTSAPKITTNSCLTNSQEKEMPDIIEKHYGSPHAEMVAALVKPGADILATLTPEKVNTWHMSTGVVGEAGELSEAVKKYVAYNKPLDRANVVEELGDLEFYLEGIRQSLGITRAETIAQNITKLSVRYAGLQYSDAAAQARVDKA